MKASTYSMAIMITGFVGLLAFQNCGQVKFSSANAPFLGKLDLVPNDQLTNTGTTTSPGDGSGSVTTSGGGSGSTSMDDDDKDDQSGNSNGHNDDDSSSSCAEHDSSDGTHEDEADHYSSSIAKNDKHGHDDEDDDADDEDHKDCGTKTEKPAELHRCYRDEGPGKSSLLAFVSENELGFKQGIPREACVTKYACEVMAATKFGEKLNSFTQPHECEHNPHVVRVSDDDLAKFLALVPEKK